MTEANKNKKASQKQVSQHTIHSTSAPAQHELTFMHTSATHASATQT